MANSKELKALIVLAGKIDPSLQSAMLKASGESLKLSNRLQASAKGMNHISTIAKGAFLGDMAARGVTAITSKMWEMSTQGIKLASDLNEVQNVVDTTFGQGANQLNVWSKSALKAFGLSELSAKQYAGTIGAMLKSSGVANDATLKMSENLTALVGDISSFYNIDQEMALEKIRAGLAGETEPLRQLGINMTVANLQAYALSKGITTSYEKMDQASQMTLRYNYLLEHSKDAQGDFTKTQGSFANQMRLFDTNMKQLSSTIAQKALPYLTQWLQTANNWVQNVDVAKIAGDVAGAFNTLGNTISWTRDNSYWLIPAISGVAATLGTLKVLSTITGLYKAFTLATEAQTVAQNGLNLAMLASPIGWASLLVGAGVAGYMTSRGLSTETKQQMNSASSYSSAGRKGYDSGESSSTVPVGPSGLGSAGRRRYGIGGIATAPSIFGEAGAEMAIPLQRTSRSLGLLQQTANILGVGGAGEVSLTFAPVIQSGGGPEVQRALGAAFEQFKVWADQYFEDKERVAYGR